MSLGHAGLRIAGTKTIGIVDPWFDPAGAYLGSWFPLPDNRHLLTPAILRPDWVVVTGDGDDRCDPGTLARLPRATPTFVPAGRPSLTNRLRPTGLHLVEVPPATPIKLDDDGSYLEFVRTHDPVAGASSVVLSVDRVSLLVCAPSPPESAHLHDIRSTTGDRAHVVAVQVARPAREPLCAERVSTAVRAHATRARELALEDACAVARATRASVVLTHGGPPCFLDPELAHLNTWISSSGLLPDLEHAADLLRARLPEQRVMTLFPGDRAFPADDLVIDEPRWRGFSFVTLGKYLREYGFTRAVELSRLHSRFPDPDDSLGRGFASYVAQLPSPNSPTVDHVRFEVTGPGGGDWDVVADERGVAVVVAGSLGEPASRVRIASNWLAAAIDGQVEWAQLLRSFRYTIAHTDDSVDEPVLDLLERSQPPHRASAGAAAPTDR